METRLEKVEIAVDGEEIAATLLVPATTVPGVLFVHGWGDSQEQDIARAREAAGLGCVCLTFDLRGHARTSAKRKAVTREDNLRDLVAAYDLFAGQRGVDAASMAVVGISYGGYLAALLTEVRPVRWLALRAPALYKDEGWDLPKLELNRDPDLPRYRRTSLGWEANRVLRACAAFRGDVLIVESERDEIIPRQVVKNYVSAFVRPRSITARMIEEADHALSEERWQRAYTSLLVNWLTEMIVGARANAAAPPERPSTAPASGVRG